MLDVLAASSLEDDRVDSFEVEQLREDEAGGTGADDPDLRPFRPQPELSSLMTRWKTAKALFAAGTPQ
jgi:hypothetical protein